MAGFFPEDFFEALADLADFEAGFPPRVFFEDFFEDFFGDFPADFPNASEAT